MIVPKRNPEVAWRLEKGLHEIAWEKARKEEAKAEKIQHAARAAPEVADKPEEEPKPEGRLARLAPTESLEMNLAFC